MRRLLAIDPECIVVTPNARTLFSDVSRAASMYEVWGYFAIEDVVARYKRTILGPLWNAAYVIATATAFSLVFGGVFNEPLQIVLPRILAGFIAWNISAGLILEGVSGLTQFSGTIKSADVPYFWYIFRMVARALIFYAHNLLVFVIVMIPLGAFRIMHFSLPAALLVGIFASVPWCFLLAMLGARYRDVQQFVFNFGQVAFFITPVVWDSRALKGPRQEIATLNPLSYLVDLIRQPMLGLAPSGIDWVVVTLVGVVGWILLWPLMARFGRRIPFWV